MMNKTKLIFENDMMKGYVHYINFKMYLVEHYPTLDNASRLYLYTFFVVAVSEKVGE